jgi:transposase
MAGRRLLLPRVNRLAPEPERAGGERRMHGQMKRHEVQLLRSAGHKQGDVAELTGVGERSIRRIENEEPVTDFDDAKAVRKRGVGRPSKVARFEQRARDWLAAEPELMTLELLRRAREEGYDGSKSPFFAMVKRVRPRKPAKPLVRFEGLPGEFSQHDFGQVEVRFLDDTKTRIHFFASRLKWSRWIGVTRVPDQRVESLLRPLVEHFDAMGGVPLLSVFDRPKTVALEWKKDGTVTKYNPTFIDVMNQLRVGVEVCWPYRPQEKGSVENLVGWVKRSFFKQRRFVDLEDLDRQLAKWIDEANCKINCRATGVPPAARIAEERARLRPLRISPEELYLPIPVQIGPTGYAVHETNRYSMPPSAIGLAATLYLGREKVIIRAGRWVCEHDRLFGKDAISTLGEHRTEMVANVSGHRGKRYLRRQQLLDLGDVVYDYLTELVHRRPRIWSRDIDEMHELLVHFGDATVREAIREALEQELYGAEYVRHMVPHVITSMPQPTLFEEVQ